ncbi:MAG: AMP-binding protein [Rudaea sp.]|uniref:AMP-binding protein n=1 Tax=Rudaea sp. TaxID=2136325 RepID=UPI0039E4A6DB
MSAVFENARSQEAQKKIPLLADADFDRVFAWHDGRKIRAAEFLADVRALAERLPEGRHALNLCTQRYRFLVAFCAAAVKGQTNLLPPSRAPQVLAEILRAYPNHYALTDEDGAPAETRTVDVRDAPAAKAAGAFAADAALPADQIVAIGFTSGSTGAPKANRKTWGGFCASSALNLAALTPSAGDAFNVLATVPPQHMFGMELSVLLPLRSRAAIHVSQPLLPADIALALESLPAPRMLVTTPFHLRALHESGVALPPLAAVVTATAPLSAELAAAVETRFATRVIELFGSTETCVIAQRRTAFDEAWSLYAGVELHPQPDGTLASAPHFLESTLLQDIVELLPERRFKLRGRNGDLLEIAGKRASLADLTKRLLAIEGVVDGVVFQLDAEPDCADEHAVRRLAALVVAPQLSEAHILEALRATVDPAFLPRPLRRVDALPRNTTGKLPRAALLAAL